MRPQRPPYADHRSTESVPKCLYPDKCNERSWTSGGYSRKCSPSDARKSPLPAVAPDLSGAHGAIAPDGGSERVHSVLEIQRRARVPVMASRLYPESEPDRWGPHRYAKHRCVFNFAGHDCRNNGDGEWNLQHICTCARRGSQFRKRVGRWIDGKRTDRTCGPGILNAPRGDRSDLGRVAGGKSRAESQSCRRCGDHGSLARERDGHARYNCTRVQLRVDQGIRLPST